MVTAEQQSAPGDAQEVKMPKKAIYRARAHSNPLNDSVFPVPLSPDHVEW